jgi:tetratricopeptide (TPR) repeat protein
MDAVTYPNDKLINFINESVVPLRVASDHKPLSSDFNVQWTPALLVLDQNGKEHHRTVGFMSADELLPSLLLGIGNAHFDNGNFNEALGCYGKIGEKYPNSDSAAEAIFQVGVSRYKSTKDPKPLREAYEQLNKAYPDSQWAKRAYPYRLISA